MVVSERESASLNHPACLCLCAPHLSARSTSLACVCVEVVSATLQSVSLSLYSIAMDFLVGHPDCLILLCNCRVDFEDKT